MTHPEMIHKKNWAIFNSKLLNMVRHYQRVATLDHPTKPGPWFLAAPSTSASRRSMAEHGGARAMRPGLVSFKVQQQWCLIYIYLYRNIMKYI